MSDYKLELALDARAHENYEEAHGLLLDCLASAAERRDGAVLANALLAFADNLLEWCPGDDDPFHSRKCATEEALTVFRGIGDPAGEARALLILASVDHDRSQEFDLAALEIGRQICDNHIIARFKTMAGFSKLFAIGGLGGAQGVDGINPIWLQIWVGDSDRQWLQAHYVKRSIKPLGSISRIVPSAPNSPELLLDACLAFYPRHFASCPSLETVTSKLKGVELLDFNLGPVPEE